MFHSADELGSTISVCVRHVPPRRGQHAPRDVPEVPGAARPRRAAARHDQLVPRAPGARHRRWRPTIRGCARMEAYILAQRQGTPLIVRQALARSVPGRDDDRASTGFPVSTQGFGRGGIFTPRNGTSTIARAVLRVCDGQADRHLRGRAAGVRARCLQHDRPPSRQHDPDPGSHHLEGARADPARGGRPVPAARPAVAERHVHARRARRRSLPDRRRRVHDGLDAHRVRRQAEGRRRAPARHDRARA